MDFLVSLPKYDGQNLGVQGGSQGGALSIITAALDPRINYLVAYYPALSDMTGYLNKRAGGWPHIFADSNLKYYNNPKVIETLSYYDVVNFARILKTPGFYSWGYNDDTCPPTSFYAAYNQIKAPKEVFVIPETGHWKLLPLFHAVPKRTVPKMTDPAPVPNMIKPVFFCFSL